MKPKYAFMASVMVSGALVTVLMTAGCSQDPYADKSEAIKQGVAPELDHEPPVPKPLASDAIRIDTSDFYTFKEQIAGEITIAGRVLSAGSKFDLSIDNLSEFPGATFDSATGSFKWTPPRDSTNGDYGSPKRLVARLTAPSPTGGATLGTTKAILVYVTRAELDPEIIAIDDLVKVATREGEIRKFEVTVKDPDASDVDGSRPRLLSVPAQRGRNDVASLVYLQESTTTDPNPVRDAADPTIWKFKMFLDLGAPANQRGRNFTATQETFKFGLQVTSKFGRIGMKSVDASILTDVLKPEVTWGDTMPVTAIAGIENVIQFTAYDPYSEGKITVNFVTRVDQLPGFATSNCDVASREGNVLCQIKWKPDASTKGDFLIDFKVSNESRVKDDRKFQDVPFTRKIIVKPGSVAPTPPVTPPTTPPVTPVTPAPVSPKTSVSAQP